MTELHKIAFDYRNAVLPDDAHGAWQELAQYVKQLINDEREAIIRLIDEMRHTDRDGVIDAIRARGEI